MNFTVAVALLAVLAVLVMLAAVFTRSAAHAREMRDLATRLSDALEAKHRAILHDLHSGLTQQGDRIGGHLTESSERLRSTVGDELVATRETVHVLKLSLERSMGDYR